MEEKHTPFKKHLTEDGSVSYFSEEYGEAFHSLSGALQEAMERFVVPCNVPNLAKEGHLKLMDIGFGLGYNSAVALQQAWISNPRCTVEILGFEKDLRVLALVKEITVPEFMEPVYSLLRRLPEKQDPSIEEGKVKVTVLTGPAEARIREARGGFHGVFLDPFSPGKNPELWTVSFFREIQRLVCPAAVVSTYSAATRVKLAFLEAGFNIGPGPKVGAKGSGTLATMEGTLPLMKPKELRKLKRRVEREKGKRE